MHKVLDGPVDKSYGVHVASLAGMPKELTSRANEILSKYENENTDTNKKTSSQISFDFSEKEESKVEEYLKDMDVDDISPKMAMDILYILKDMIK